MPSSTFVLNGVTYNLVAQSSNGATYKNAARTLGLPQTLEFQYNVGNPGQKGNDRLNITLRNAVNNSTTGVVSVGSLSIVISVPRDSAWEDGFTEGIIDAASDLLSNTTSAAAIADAIVP